MSQHKDTLADLKIKACINRKKNFAVIAGAGSGKTTSLIKALSYVCNKYGKSLHIANQKIVCITYTKAAVNVIEQRTNLDDLFAISTIHSFLWRLIENYQSDIRVTFKDKLIPKRIQKQQEDDNGGNSQKAQKARKQIAELNSNLENIHAIDKFSYGDNGRRDYTIGKLNHDDVIDLASIMILDFPNLRKIIGQKFPFIFIDESQDTFGDVMNALNLVASRQGLPMIGYFGDPMQRIYDNNKEEFKAPANFKLIKKLENYRCSVEVIKLLNVIRPDLQQKPGKDNKIGSVEIRLIESENGNGDRNTYTEEQISEALGKFDAALDYFGWSKSNDVKKLFLTRQMIAKRLGFSRLNKLFTGVYASKTTEDDFKAGEYFALKPFIDVLIPLIEAHEKNDHAAIIQIMRQNSPLLDPHGSSEFLPIKEVTEKAKVAINALVASWQNDTLKDILNTANKHELINLSERLAEHLDREPRAESYVENIHEREKGDWLIDEFFKFKTDELAVYRKFILDLTPYNTQHGVKGDEFEKVLVVFDDTEANWNLYSYSGVLIPSTTGKQPTEGQKQRSLNLAYVCFSRAIQDLRIILFTENPEKAKKEFIDKKWFTENQISIQE